MEKLRIKRVTISKDDSSTEVTRIKKVSNALANDVAREAGISKVEALHKMLVFAYENIEWVGDVE